LSSIPNRLYHNNQDGTFTDFDGDRWPDLLVGGDYDEDGDIDFHLSDIHWPLTNLKGSRLLINDGNHTFSEKGTAAGVNAAGWGWGNAATDIDNDGLLDIVATNGWLQMQWQNYPTKVFYNLGNMQYAELSAWCGLVHFGAGRGLIKWDPDQDGDEDILIAASGEPLAHFRNDLANGNAWLRVNFDTSANPALAPNGFGTTVWATVNGRTLMRQIDSSISHLSQHELTAHFGFGPGVTQVDELRIEWADGFDTVLSNVAIDQLLTVAAEKPFVSSSLIRGQSATLTLTGAQAGEQVLFLSSLVGFGGSPPIPQLGGQRLGILPPIRLAGSAMTNSNGQATYSALIPNGAPLVGVYLQAVVQRGVNGRDSVISNSINKIIQ